MRTITYGAACSLDGFITGPDESIDWLHFSKDVEQIMAEYWANVDTVLMGRRTWDFAVRSAGGGDGGGGPVSGLHTYVFSRTLTDIDKPGVTLVRDNAAEFVRRLKNERGKDICMMGGSDLAQSLFHQTTFAIWNWSIAARKARMWSGVLPQQPPMMLAPAWSSGTTPVTICAGVSS